jgi:hypothetical protein
LAVRRNPRSSCSSGGPAAAAGGRFTGRRPGRCRCGGRWCCR